MMELKKPIRARLEHQNGNLRIIVTIKGKRSTISTGLKDDPINRQLAQTIVDQILLDDRKGCLDLTFNKYKPHHAHRGGSLLSLPKLFKDYMKFKEPTLERNSLTRYTNTLKYLEEFLSLDIQSIKPDDVQRFRDILLKKVSPNTAKEYLCIIKACFIWAIDRNLTTQNPFIKASKGIKSVETKESQYFEASEIRLIFEKVDLITTDYADFIKFLLLTGCRPGEAIALKWRDVNLKTNKLTIDKSFDGVTFKATKTGKSRTFSMDDKLMALLKSQGKSKNCDLVFHIDEKPIVYDHFFGQWTRLLKQLGIDYKSPYSTRHTFITHACRQMGEGAIADIANKVGNSPSVIYSNYLHKDVNKVVSISF